MEVGTGTGRVCRFVLLIPPVGLDDIGGLSYTITL